MEEKYKRIGKNSRIGKAAGKRVHKGERERNWGNGQEGKRARKRKKELEEVRNGGTQREAGGEQERWTGDRIVEERRKRETEERRKRIRESRYNRYYRNITKEETPKYLKGRMKWKDRKMIATFRCGNETKAKEHWKKEGEKRCRLCGREEEDLRHVIEECEITGGAKGMEKTLNETGEGLRDLRAIIEKRSWRPSYPENLCLKAISGFMNGAISPEICNRLSMDRLERKEQRYQIQAATRKIADRENMILEVRNANIPKQPPTNYSENSIKRTYCSIPTIFQHGFFYKPKHNKKESPVLSEERPHSATKPFISSIFASPFFTNPSTK
ncbi:vicilin-like seed storage protein At2g18540 [Bombus pyrosoma]|uniref:vicilin-like seed storage protein At2g18540 n=1 Tax=Bombus pyrosoma TaxID=396416 RepID=UPI001CB8CB7C|nr:vicilin-like seed storage protein At2g18540 [Bombus pyrosoma]